MLSDFRTRKLERLFAVMDIDSDGVLTDADAETFVESLATLRELDRSSSKFETFRDGFLVYWNDFVRQADLDGDRKVTPEEWLVYHDEMLEDETRFQATTIVSASMMFMVMDANQDGRISLEEYGQWMRAWGMGDESVNAEIFAKLDRNGDGHLSNQEVVEMTTEFYYSEDPDAPGNWAMGPF